MKKTAVLLFIFSILFLGAGCSSDKNETATSTVKTVINKKPNSAEIKNPINDFCKNNGYELIIRFDKKSQSSKAYCRFKNGTECEALAYYQKKCTPGKDADIYINKNFDKDDNLSICTNVYEPVCGADGINYTNNCLAQIQGIKIVHEGVCTEKEITIIEQDIQNEKQTDSASDYSTPIDVQSDWLSILKDLVLTAPASDPSPYIEKCNIGGNTYFYYSDGCSTCFDAVYGAGGQIICYPHNNLDNSCPAKFDRSTRQNFCTRTWQDPR